MKTELKKILCIFLILTFVPLVVFILRDSGEDFKVYDISSGKIIKIDEREYLIGALAYSMPPTFHKEALKAGAVAIYTNALASGLSGKGYAARINSRENKGYIDTDALKESWGKNFDTYYEKICSAVDETRKMVISYDGKLICAAYHFLCSGKTESAENVWGQKVPYLVSVESEGDTFSSDLTSNKKVSINKIRETFENSFDEIFLPKDDSLLFTDFSYSDSGTVLSVTVGNLKLTGQKIREMFSLPSAAFTVSIDNENVTFNITGRGHGVGMSLYGADFLARQKKSFDEILCHYYKNCSVVKSAM